MSPNIPTLTADFYLAALPILILCTGGIIAMLQSVFNSVKGQTAVAFVMFFSLTAALFSSFIQLPAEIFLNGEYITGDIARFGQSFILIVAVAIALLFKESYLANKFFRGEISALYMMTFAGMLTMVSSNDLITLFVGLELSSIGLYTLIGYIEPTRKSREGAIKYFILGSFAAAILLFGFGLLYAATGSMNLMGIIKAVPEMANHTWILFGGMLVIIALGFKMALVPFHLWAPDAYEGAPTGITAILATCAKLMIIIVTLRIFSGMLEPVADAWLPMLSFLAILSMIIGNIMALVQNNIKRMLAYSSIAHSGYMAIAICAIAGRSALPYQSILFYMIGYTLASLVAFGVLMWLENKKADSLTLTDFSGLAKNHPWAAFAMAVAMFSFAGMPPTVGFLGKFFIFNAAINHELYSLVIIGAIGSSISLYYYLRVIVKMYMTEKPETGLVFTPNKSLVTSIIIGAALTATVALGTLFPAKALDALEKPSQSLISDE